MYKPGLQFSYTQTHKNNDSYQIYLGRLFVETISIIGLS